MEWKSGLILRIKDYKFEDDQSVRDKYAIVLYADKDQAYIIHSLTTSQNNKGLPAMQYGCSVHHFIPYYFIPQGQVIGDNNFSFERDTFIFFRNNVRKESTIKFESAAKKIFGLAILGVLSNDELKRIIKCAMKSKFIPAEVEKELSVFKASL